MIQLHRLEGFYWVARTGGYARAARAFPYPITQPAVHQQVKKLETELELSLFEHVGKEGMKLTPAGTRLYEFVAPFFDGLPAVVRSLEEGEYGGEIVVAAAPLSLRSILPSWVKRVHEAYPHVRVHMREATHLDLGALMRGEVDMFIDYFPEIPDECASMRVGVMRPFLVVPASHPLAEGESVRLSDCVGETFIAYTPNSHPYDLQMQALAAYDVKPPVIHTASAADSILGIVEAGLGYTLIPSFAEEGPVSPDLRAYPLSDPSVEYPVHAIWRKDTPENPVLDALLEVAPKPRN